MTPGTGTATVVVDDTPGGDMCTRTIWVDSVNGDDDGSGTTDAPFRTFVRAMQSWRADHTVTRDVAHRAIALRPGRYILDGEGLALFADGYVRPVDGLLRVYDNEVHVRPARNRSAPLATV